LFWVGFWEQWNEGGKRNGGLENGEGKKRGKNTLERVMCLDRLRWHTLGLETGGVG